MMFRRSHVWVNYVLQLKREEGRVSLKNQGMLRRVFERSSRLRSEPRTNRDGQSFTTKWTLRFFCQHELLCWRHNGRSFPKLVTSTCKVSKPRFSRYCWTPLARRSPRTRLYSTVPISSVRPSSNTFFTPFAFNRLAFSSTVVRASSRRTILIEVEQHVGKRNVLQTGGVSRRHFHGAQRDLLLLLCSRRSDLFYGSGRNRLNRHRPWIRRDAAARPGTTPATIEHHHRWHREKTDHQQPKAVVHGHLLLHAMRRE